MKRIHNLPRMSSFGGVCVSRLLGGVTLLGVRGIGVLEYLVVTIYWLYLGILEYSLLERMDICENFVFLSK